MVLTRVLMRPSRLVKMGFGLVEFAHDINDFRIANKRKMTAFDWFLIMSGSFVDI
jgi:hypothetical protein